MPNLHPLTSPSHKIALLVLNASDWSRKVHEGVLAYARLIGGWDYWLPPRGIKEDIFMPDDWDGAGIIGRFANDELIKGVEKWKIPKVNISWHKTHTPDLPKVMSDQHACGRLAAGYFQQAGFINIAYAGPQKYLGYEDRILNGVKEICTEHKLKCDQFIPDEKINSPDIYLQRQAIACWISKLPKPSGIIAWSTIVARELIVVAMQNGIDIPNDLAILAVEHDPLHSSLSPIPISFVLQRPQVVGYESAALLHRMIQGEDAPEHPVLIAPEGISESLSTNTAFALDEIVQKSILFIREQLSEPISVDDIAKKVNVSRRSLEDRFRKVLNRSPAEEIRRIRLNEIKLLLRNTQLSLQEISLKCGFSYLEVMMRFFKKATNETPSEYRKNAGDRSFSPSSFSQ